MTDDECKALVKGDVVYYRSALSDMSNAAVETPSGLRNVRLVPLTVVKVCKKVVKCHGLSIGFGDIVSHADAQAAMERYAEVQARKAADARRINAAVGRIEHAGFSARTHYSEMQVYAPVSSPDAVERLADIIVTGARAVDLMAEFRMACPVTDAPMVTLHLSVEQAEQAFAALKGGE